MLLGSTGADYRVNSEYYITKQVIPVLNRVGAVRGVEGSCWRCFTWMQVCGSELYATFRRHSHCPLPRDRRVLRGAVERSESMVSTRRMCVWFVEGVEVMWCVGVVRSGERSVCEE